MEAVDAVHPERILPLERAPPGAGPAGGEADVGGPERRHVGEVLLLGVVGRRRRLGARGLARGGVGAADRAGGVRLEPVVEARLAEGVAAAEELSAGRKGGRRRGCGAF